MIPLLNHYKEFYGIHNNDLSALKGSASVNETVNLTVGIRYKTPKDGYWWVAANSPGACGGAIYKDSTTQTAICGISITSGQGNIFVRKGLYIDTQSLSSGSISYFTPIDMVAD